MDITSILAVVDGSDSSGLVLEAAFEAGRAFDATVVCLYAQSPIAASFPRFGGIGAEAVVRALLEADRRARQKRREHVEEAFQRSVAAARMSTFEANGGPLPSGFTAGLQIVSGHPGPEIARRGRLHDLIVVAPPQKAAGGIDATEFEATLFDTARPVLIAGKTVPAMSGVRALVAWDGSREAALALHMALPLLTAATEVEVLTVAGNDGGPDPAEAAVFLARHGIVATARRLGGGNRDPARVLVEACGERRSGLLVMGAYGNSPFSDCQFGGVTRRVFEAAPTSILVAH